MQIEELIKEKLLGIKQIGELERNERKKFKLLSKATRTWKKLATDCLNNKLGNC